MIKNKILIRKMEKMVIRKNDGGGMTYRGNYMKHNFNIKFFILTLLVFGFVLLTSIRIISAHSRSGPAYTFGHQTYG